MRKALTSILMAAVAAGAMAQTKHDPFDFVVSDFRLLQSRPVQTELKITQAQRDQMNRFARQHDERVKALEKSLAGKQRSEATDKEVQTKLVGFLGQLKTDVLGALSKTQVKRLREITLQGYGYAALADERVAKRVGLSAAQIGQIRKALNDGRAQAAKLQQAAVQPIVNQYKDRKPKDQKQAQALNQEIQGKMRSAEQRVRPQIIRLEQSTESKLRSVLSARQRQTFAALQGKKFTPK